MTNQRRRRRNGLLGAGGALAIVLSLLTAPTSMAVTLAPADGETELLVTYVARSCASYSDIMANKARNNLMESLRDLGPDSTYPSNGIVNPTAEAAGTPNCQPLSNWRFTLGQNFTVKTPASLNLSTVTSPYGTDIVTGASTPVLDPDGNATGQTIEGAVTVALDSAQVNQLAAGRKLWVQGGSPAQPLNGLQTRYGFGALRCAQDALNGDNVERLTFPGLSRHIFCYYYAVTPPPEAGTIIVRKELAPGTNGSGRFRFDGSLSYADENGDGTNDFALNASAASPGSATFIRGAVGPADPPWTFAEAPSAGWQAPGPPVCTTNLGSPITVDPATFEVSVRLVADDTVTCAYTNSRLLTGAERLSKETLGGVGSFPFLIDVPAPNPDVSTTAQTTTPGEPVLVASTFGSIPGDYTVTETLPAPTPAGSWEAASAACNGVTLPMTTSGQDRSWTRNVAVGEQVDCLVTNQFTPGGSITIEKTTIGGVGAFDFDVEPLDASGSPTDDAYLLSAETTAEGVAVPAVPSGPAPDGLVVDPATQYLIQEFLPPLTVDGFWRTTAVDCGSASVTVDLANSSAIVTLTTAVPDASCSFTNEFVPAGRAVVSKRSTADTALRPGSADLLITCDEGTVIPLTVPAGRPNASTIEYAVYGDVSCTVEETANGAAPGVTETRTATISIDGGPPTPLAAPFTFDLAASRSVAVVVDDVLATGPRPPAQLANSGFPAQGLLALGLGAIAAAGVLLLAARRWRRS